MKRNKYLYFIKCNRCQQEWLGYSQEKEKITKFCFKCYSTKIEIQKTIQKENHIENDQLINGNPKILCLTLPSKTHKWYYRWWCRHCKIYIKHARRTRINEEHWKCPLCRKDYPSFISEGTYKDKLN